MTGVDDWRDPCDHYEPPEPDFDAEAEEYWRHCQEAHGGQSCDWPAPLPGMSVAWTGEAEEVFRG